MIVCTSGESDGEGVKIIVLSKKEISGIYVLKTSEARRGAWWNILLKFKIADGKSEMYSYYPESKQTMRENLQILLLKENQNFKFFRKTITYFVL